MNRKKLKKAIITGVLLFYLVSSLCMLFVLTDSQEKEFRSTLNSVISSEYARSMAGHFDGTETDTKEKSDEAARLFMHYYADSIRAYNDIYSRPFSLAIQDRDGNITYLHDNFLYWGLGDDVCVSLDGYLTDEIRKELKAARKDRYNALVEEVRLSFDGEKYIPVEIDFRGQGNYYEDYRKTVKITELEPDKTIVNNPVALGVCLLELETEPYNRPYYAKLKDILGSEYNRLKDSVGERFGREFGAVGYSYFNEKEGLYGNMDVAIGEGYRMYFAFCYNPYLVTLFSDYCRSMLICLAVIFSLVGVIFYALCMRVANKSERLEEAKATFISAASHELKTPIAVIQSRCECLMENVAPEKRDGYLKAIHDEALRMDGIVASLLTYNRIAQLTHIEKEKCDLTELVRQEIKSYLAFAEKSGVTLEDCTDEGVYAECNGALMKMAIDNYLSNAVKYAQGDRLVTVELWKKGSGFILSVTNEGEEKSVAAAEQAWQELSRGDGARQRAGSSVGMGLAVCRRIFGLHGYRGGSVYKDGRVTFTVEGS